MLRKILLVLEEQKIISNFHILNNKNIGIGIGNTCYHLEEENGKILIMVEKLEEYYLD